MPGGNADRTAITSGNGNKHTVSGRVLSAPRMTHKAGSVSAVDGSDE